MRHTQQVEYQFMRRIFSFLSQLAGGIGGLSSMSRMPLRTAVEGLLGGSGGLSKGVNNGDK